MNDTQDAGTSVNSPPERRWTELRRSDNTLVGGVGQGVADYYEIDPVLTRVAFVAATLVGFSGLFAYLGLWFLLPTASGHKSIAARWFPLGSNELTVRRIGLIGTGIVTLLAFAGGLTTAWNPVAWIVWIALPALALWWVFVVLPKQRAEGRASAQHGEAESTTPPYGSDPAAYVPTDDTRLEAPETTAVTDGGDPVIPTSDTEDHEPCDTPGDPRLTIVTLSLAAIACGILGIWDVTGGPVEPATYAATTLAVIGGGLLIGSLLGDGRGLIGWGFVAAAALAVTAVTPWHGVGDINERPGSTTDLRSEYSLSTGHLTLDLSDLEADDLHGRAIDLDLRVGAMEIVVPDDVDIRFTGTATIGGIEVFDRRNNGIQIDMIADDRGPETLSIDAHVGVGNIEVRNP